MSYAGYVDHHRVYRCDICGANQVDSPGFRSEEWFWLAGQPYAVDLCGDCYDTGQAVPYLVDRHGGPLAPGLVADELCSSCRAPSCDCEREAERDRWREAS